MSIAHPSITRPSISPRTIARQETKIFLRSRATQYLLLLYAFLCAVAIGNGYMNLNKSQAEYAEVNQRFVEQNHHWQEVLNNSDNPVESAGNAAYYSFMPAWHQPSAWSALFPGQRVDYNSLMRIRLLALRGQMNDEQLQNFHHTTTGTLTLDFIWIYLLPLLIGILSVNLIADDKERQRWPLILATATSPTRLILIRLAVRLLLLYGLNIVVLAVACLLLSITDTSAIAIIAGLLFLYHLLWLALSAIVIQRQQGRRQNLINYCVIWITLTFLVPGMLYLHRLDSAELALGIQATVDQRESMNNSWDENKQVELDAYLKQYPQWADTAPLPEVFHWKWYYAMQHRSDDIVADTVAHYRQGQLNHYNSAQTLRWFSPATSLQMALWRIADTDVVAYINYQDQLATYHQALHNFYLPYMFFENKRMTGADLNNIPLFNYQPSATKAGAAQSFSSLLFFLTLAMVALAIMLWRQHLTSHK